MYALMILTTTLQFSVIKTGTESASVSNSLDAIAKKTFEKFGKREYFEIKKKSLKA